MKVGDLLKNGIILTVGFVVYKIFFRRNPPPSLHKRSQHPLKTRNKRAESPLESTGQAIGGKGDDREQNISSTLEGDVPAPEQDSVPGSAPGSVPESESTPESTPGPDLTPGRGSPPDLDLASDPAHETEAKKIPKENIPPRRGGQGRDGTRDKEEFLEVPQVICWREEGGWAVGVQFEERYDDDLRVVQNSTPLIKDSLSEKPRFRILHLSENIDIEISGERQEIKLSKLANNRCLFFKTRNNWDGVGRLVRKLSYGYYLVLAPEIFQRDIDRVREYFIHPEQTNIQGYLLHYFFIDKEAPSPVAFQVLGNSMFFEEPEIGRFVLEGKILDMDTSEKIGAMYISDPPVLRDLKNSNWVGIKEIVIGEEGSGIGKWRIRLIPPESHDCISLNVLSDHGYGWYFLRIYNSEDQLIETFDFRYAEFLKGVELDMPAPFPGESGHGPTMLVFNHGQGVNVAPPENEGILVTESSDRTSFLLPPSPDLDSTKWKVYRTESSYPIEMTIVLDRVWWSVMAGDGPPSKWLDRLIQFNLEVFKATSDKYLWVRCGYLGADSRVSARFGSERDRALKRQAGTGLFNLPFRDFCDEQLLRIPGNSKLTLQIDTKGTVIESVVGTVDKAFECVFCNHCTYEELTARQHVVNSHRKEIGELFPHVDYNEMRMRDVTLPREIYKCYYCNYYVSSDDRCVNPTSGITHHIDYDCRNVNRRLPIKVRFNIVDSVDVIRREVIHNLPKVLKCSLCVKRFTNPIYKELTDHLVSHHRKHVYNLISMADRTT